MIKKLVLLIILSIIKNHEIYHLQKTDFQNQNKFEIIKNKKNLENSKNLENQCNEICQKIKLLLKKNNEKMKEIEKETSNLIDENLRKTFKNNYFKNQNNFQNAGGNKLEWLLKRNNELKILSINY